MDTPLGTLLLRGNADALTGIYMENHRHGPVGHGTDRRDDARFADARQQFSEYFAGQRTTFDLPLDRSTGTAFQRQVWQGLLDIPYGETITYGELARRIGQPAAVRAVGLANGRNPISIIVPCHRVIGAGGKLTGYGGGLENKRRLLELEARHRPGDLFEQAEAVSSVTPSASPAARG